MNQATAATMTMPQKIRLLSNTLRKKNLSFKENYQNKT